MAIETSGAITFSSVSQDCSFWIELSVGHTYNLNFYLKDGFVATLVFETGDESFLSSTLTIVNGEETIDLGMIRILDETAISSIQPLGYFDQDGDGILDIDDEDDNDDGVVDAENEDTDLDGVIDVLDSDDDGDGEVDLDEDDEDGNLALEEIELVPVLEVKPRNDTHPELGDDNVDLDKKIKARFGCEIDPDSVTESTFQVKSEKETVGCSYKFFGTGVRGNSVRCEHDAFLPGTVYTATTKGIFCTDGRTVEPKRWSWRTEERDEEEGDAEDNEDDEDEISFIAFGDWGSGDQNQLHVASAMENYCSRRQCDFVVTLGDNFYENGVTSTQDPQWQTKYRDVYGDLGLPFYPSLGNHDLYGNFQAQIDYSLIDPSWRMKGEYYSVAFPEDSEEPLLEIFLFSSYQFSAKAETWLKDAIDASRAKWKILAMHVPIISDGPHGVFAPNELKINDRLLSIICGKIDVVLSGHDHIFSHLRGDLGICEIEQLVIGTGGAGLYDITADPRALSSSASFYGFGWFKVSKNRLFFDNRLLFRMIKEDGEVGYGAQWRK